MLRIKHFLSYHEWECKGNFKLYIKHVGFIVKVFAGSVRDY
jgi:hypothetical protein